MSHNLRSDEPKLKFKARESSDVRKPIRKDTQDE